jgi:hypothetical protein
MLCLMLVSGSSVGTSGNIDSLIDNDKVSEVDSKEPVKGEWKEVEREERKIGTSLTITSANK